MAEGTEDGAPALPGPFQGFILLVDGSVLYQGNCLERSVLCSASRLCEKLVPRRRSRGSRKEVEPVYPQASAV